MTLQGKNVVACVRIHHLEWIQSNKVMVNRSTETGLRPHPETVLEAYLLIMTPDTASSSAAMRAEVPTDRPRARWERDGWGGSRVTSTRQGAGGGGTTWFHTC